MTTKPIPTTAPYTWFVLASAAAALVAGCVTRQPTHPALAGFAGTCDATAAPQPYTMDLHGPERGSLVAAMNRGSVVMAYACGSAADGTAGASMRVLDGCHAGAGEAGYYQFAPYPLDTERPFFRSADELRVNLPVHGVELGAYVGEQRAIGVTYSVVGQYSLARTSATSAELWADIPGACVGATHVVRRIHVGAFDLQAVTTTGAGATAAVPGAGASLGAGTVVGEVNAAGELAACISTPDAPPPTCSSPVKLELLPINGPEIPDSIDVPSCPPTQVYAQGACRQQVAGEPFACRFGRYAECRAQCDAGNPASCNTLGHMLEHGVGAAKNPTDALQVYDRACRGRDKKGCANYALLLRATDKQVAVAFVNALLEDACSFNVGYACGLADGIPGVQVAILEPYVHSLVAPLGIKPPPIGNVALLQRGCRAGDPGSCQKLRAMGVPR
jgi:hypothetical protein